MRFNIRHEIICFSERYGANEPNKMIILKMSAYLVKTYTLKICICNETITKLFTTFLCLLLSLREFTVTLSKNNGYNSKLFNKFVIN